MRQLDVHLDGKAARAADVRGYKRDGRSVLTIEGSAPWKTRSHAGGILNQHGKHRAGFCYARNDHGRQSKIVERESPTTEPEIRMVWKEISAAAPATRHIVNAGKAAAAKAFKAGTIWPQQSPHRNLVGKRIRRREDPRRITGKLLTSTTLYKCPGRNHACMAQPPHGAAK